MKTFVPLILTLISASVYAGGDYFPIHITKFSSDKDKFRFTARISKERAWMESECKDISVVGEYDTLKWALKKAPMNRENHMEAIEYLRRSYHNKEKVYFGYVGYGLKPISKCSYVSKGLILERDNKEFVVSVHDSI